MNLQSEYRLYRRHERGRVINQMDHLMDALRYGVMSFDAIGRVRPADPVFSRHVGAADPIVGY